MEKTLKIKLLSPLAALPRRATAGAAAMDLCAALEQPVTIMPGERELIPTGIAIELPSSDMVALVFSRSGLATKKGISLSNSVGVIDSDYRGELKVGLINHSDSPFTVSCGDRIAQLMVTYALCLPVEQVQELSGTERGEGGFGSTGTAAKELR